MKPRPLVTFDLDGVLARPPFGLNPGGLRAGSAARVTPGRRSVFWYLEPWRYAARRPMEGVAEGLRLLDDDQVQWAVLSARSEASRGLTQAWLARHFSVQPQVYLRPSWRETPAAFKARMVQALGASAHFEDDANTAEWLAELIPAVFLVDWPRNRWLRTPRVHRIRRIAEAFPLHLRVQLR
jgi:hypothetical protein